MSIRWEGPYEHSAGGGSSAEGYDDRGRVAVKVIRHSSGWRAYLRGDPVDGGRYHADAAGAMRAAEAAWELAPEPPRRRGRDRRLVGNVEGEVPPHPGTLRKLPR